MKFARILTLLLVVFMTLSLFAACAKKPSGEDGDDTQTASTVSITIKDHEGNEIYKNDKLDVDLTIDADPEGKLFIENILKLVAYYDETVTYDYDADEEILTINELASINGVKTEQVLDEEAMEQAKADAEANRPEGDTTEIEIDPIYKDVDFYYFWELKLNNVEVGIDDEIKLGDKIDLTYLKLTEEELFEAAE